MNLEQERRIHRLLLQREREFTAVWRAECEINKILGAEFPFAAPPDLPSSYRPVRKKTAARAAKTKIPRLNSIVRNLTEDENAYRVKYECEGKEYSTLQADTTLLRRLMLINSESFKLKLIETVKLESLEDYNSIEQLWLEGDLFQP